MINWFDMPDGGLSNGGLFEIKELTATENKVYQKDGEVYNKVTVNVEGGGGSSDFSTAKVTVNMSGDFALYVPYLIEEEGEIYFDTLIADSGTYNIVMYNNTASGYVIDPINASATPIISVTGNAVVGEQGGVGITGDCTITIS